MNGQILFSSNGYRIEGVYSERSSTEAVIITHPHPLYGGDMNNAIVDILDQQFLNCGYSTLKFNFRGVGASEGVYDNGEGESEDVFSAVQFLNEKGFRAIHVAGYSFGAWVLMGCATKNNVFDQIYLVSPPVSFMTFDAFSPVSNLKFAIVGDRDDFADPDDVKRVMERIAPNAKLVTLSGADHFYFGYTSQLESLIESNIPKIQTEN